MSVSAPVARVLARIAQGDDVDAACSAEGLACRRDVSVDAHYDGKPVCTVTLPWVVDGHALLQADASVAAPVAEARLASLASALAMPVCVVRRPVASLNPFHSAMSLAKITQVKALALAVPGDDIDTDRIIPARFLRCVTFDGLGEHAFRDERTGPDGKERPHPMNSAQAARIAAAKKGVMVVGFNFGCGSSREHAPQSIWRFGFTALVGGSFAEIFFGNSTTLGVPCVTLSKEDLAECDAFVRANPDVEVTVDVEKLTVSAGAKTWKASIPASARDGLVNGKWDPIADLLEGADSVAKTAGGLAYVEGK